MERHEIERNDFAQARRGYDPDEVDLHLAQIAVTVEELKRSRSSSQSGGLAGAAADQVRTIVTAAEASAAEITNDARRQADEERSAAQADADRTRSEANAAAQEARDRAESDAGKHVARVEAATAEMRLRADTIQADLGGLVDQLRTTLESVVESVRNNAGSLEAELQGIRAGLVDLDSEPAEAEPAAIPEAGLGEDQRTAGPPAAHEPVVEVIHEADHEPEPSQPLTAHEEDAEPPETAAGTTEERPAVEETAIDEPELVEEPEAEPEPQVEVEIAEEQSSGASDGAEGARLIALNMALNGTPRDETSRYLEENFDLDDRETILDEVYARVSG